MLETGCGVTAEELDQAIAEIVNGGSAAPQQLSLLCEALRHNDRQVMLKAARALGECGDETALQPLTKALRLELGGSGWWLVVPGLLSVLLVGLVALSVLAGDYPQLLLLAVIPLGVHEGRKRGEMIRVLAEALAEITERVPGCDVRQVVPSLKLTSLDLVQQRREVRGAIR
ncbi:MAG: hypothetical protein K0Q72_5496, partial [Armatimonadetes bacterium]|nr:hypothetical protein [Armatimonadota bacterium]